MNKTIFNIYTIWGIVNLLIGAILWRILFSRQFAYSENVIFGQNLGTYLLAIMLINLILVILIIRKNQQIFAIILNFLTLLLLTVVAIQIYI